MTDNRDDDPAEKPIRVDRAKVPPPPADATPPADWAGLDAPEPPPLGDRPMPDLAPLGEPPLDAPARRRGPRFDRIDQSPEDASSAAPPPSPVGAGKPPRRRKPLARRILGWIVKAILIFVLGSLLLVLAFKFINPPITLTMIGDMAGGHRITKQWMPLARMSPNMARAAIGAEDSRFCQHHGFDFDALEAAYKRNQQGGRIRGGSTISQQTAKNVFLWQGGGYVRKGLEAWFTVLIENIWGKRRIMEVYLNVAETGIGTYGANAGSMRYFRHDASQLSPREAAQIAAVLPLPKKRAAIDPRGFTRRYGNSINRRIGVVRGDGLDACLR